MNVMYSFSVGEISEDDDCDLDIVFFDFVSNEV